MALAGLLRFRRYADTAEPSRRQDGAQAPSLGIPRAGRPPAGRSNAACTATPCPSHCHGRGRRTRAARGGISPPGVEAETHPAGEGVWGGHAEPGIEVAQGGTHPVGQMVETVREADGGGMARGVDGEDLGGCADALLLGQHGLVGGRLDAGGGEYGGDG